MKMYGGNKMVQYPPEDERPHNFGSDKNWQESFVLVWWDIHAGIGGYFRLGHEPNHDGGIAVLWAAVHMPGETYFRNSELPLTAQDRFENGQSAGNEGLVYQYEGQVRWRLKDKDISLELALEDFHPAIDGYIKDGKPHMGEIQSNHVEVACRVVGAVTAKGTTHRIDGLAMRDHGWGSRDWDAIWAHRWNVGTFDKDNSFCAVSMHLPSDEIVRFGWVVRGDTVIYAEETEIVSYIMNDSVTNVGGVLRMRLCNGENFEVNFEPVAPAVLFYHNGMSCVDTLCETHWGNMTGIGVFETSGNLQKGNRRPEVLDGGIAINGWHSWPVV